MADIKARGLPGIEVTLRTARQQFNDGARAGLGIWGQKIVAESTRRIRARFRSRSGALLGSMGFEVVDESGGAPVLRVGAIRVGADGKVLRYAWQREKGGTITGRPWLAWPMDYAGNPVLTRGVRAGGVSAREVRANPGAFGFAGTFARHGIIFGKLFGRGKAPEGTKRAKGVKGAKGWDIVPLFVLRHSVTQAAGNFFFPVVEEARPRVAREVQAQIVKRLRDTAARRGGET